MIRDFLTAATIPSQAAQFQDPPSGVFAVYFDSVEADGPDGEPSRIFAHDCAVELYAPTIEAGDEAKARLEAVFNANGIHYSTQGWYWLSEIRRYQEIYEFSIIQKI